MTSEWRFGLTMAAVGAATFVIGPPLASHAVHGLSTSLWPPGALGFPDWWSTLVNGDWRGVRDLTIGMWNDAFPGLPGSGHEIGGALAFVTVSLAVWWTPTKASGPKRDPGGVFGDADWASEHETRSLRTGLELGTDPRTERTVRVPLEGNALTIAAPRTGKSMGLIVPNLVAAGKGAWNGPAVVVDPKGELFRMTGGRRRELGEQHDRAVLCLDPFGIAGGEDHWNPLDGVGADDTEALQALGNALLVDPGESNRYFRERGAELFAGVLAVALESGAGMAGAGTTLADAAALSRDRTRLEAMAKASTTSGGEALRELLAMGGGTRDPILSTMATGFGWVQSAPMARVTGGSTFSMRDVARGRADLFVCLPPDSMETMAPWVRMVLDALFRSVRRDRGADDDRVVAFVDEAASLGRFDVLREAVGSVPGAGLSLWTFWQSRGQLRGLYGPGADTFEDAAEVRTVSNVRPGEPAEQWSKALGDYTVMVATHGEGERSGQDTTTPQRRALMTPDEIAGMPRDELLAFTSGRGTPRRPMRLRKTDPFIERRFRGMLDVEGAPARIG